MKGKFSIRFRLYILLGISLYLLLFARPLGKESVVRPLWAREIPAPGAAREEGATAEGAVCFRAGEVCGSVDPEGRFLAVDAVLHDVAVAPSGFVNYDRDGNHWLLQDVRGDPRWSYAGIGYPLFSADGQSLFSVKTDLTGLRAIDGGGEVAWERDFPSLITCVSTGGGAVAVGLLDGSLEVLSGRGEQTARFTAAGSRVRVVYGSATSRDAVRIAFIAGADPQMLVLAERRGAGYAVALRKTLPTDVRREIAMGFSGSGRDLIWEENGTLAVLEPSGRTVRIPFDGPVRTLVSLKEASAALSGKRGGGDLVVFRPPSAILARESMPEGAALYGHGSRLLLGADGRLLCLEIAAD
jgi:hypothetical protein